MSSAVVNYVEQRAETLAHLVLTRRKDVHVATMGQSTDVGIDLFVQILSDDGKKIVPSFGVEVLGTSRPLEDEKSATQFAKQKWKNRKTKGMFLFPIIVLLFSMENDEGYYGWLMEPSTNRNAGPTLSRVTSLAMTRVSKKTLDEIVRRVQEWSWAMEETLAKHPTEE